jgi:AcrR family transcriptional regulator
VSDNLLDMMARTTERKTAGERREAILEAALTEFARHGFGATSTDDIARAAGISQPYLFRLFRTKKELFLASVERCFADTYDRFEQASAGLQGAEALDAMGRAYKQMISEDPRRLRGQMQSYSACDDPDVCAVVRRGFGRLVELVESKGVPPDRVVLFFAHGMLINVMTAMDLGSADDPWAARLLDAFMKGDQ